MLRPSPSLSPVSLALLLASCTLPSCSNADETDSVGEGSAGPRVATPLPEPPAFDPTQLGYDPGQTVLPGESYPIKGNPGAVAKGASVVLTNLSTGAVTVVDVAAELGDGSFATSIEASSGDWLRVEAKDTGGRSPHATFLLGDDVTLLELDPCVDVLPDGFGNSGPVVVTNTCNDEIVLHSVVVHPGETEVELDPALPEMGLPLAVGESLRIALTADDSIVLLIPVEVAGVLLPYSVVLEP